MKQFCLFLLMLAVTLTGHAHNVGAAPVVLAQYLRTSFSVDDGAPMSPTSMFETSDGFVWFVGNEGAYRTDGARFERVEIAGDRAVFDGVFSAVQDPRGGFWVSYIRSGVAYVNEHQVIRYDSDSGLPLKQVRRVISSNGQVHAATLAGWYRLDGERWIQDPPLPRLRDQPIESALLDGDGRFWLRAGNVVYHQRRAGGRFQPMALPDMDPLTTKLIADADGSVWLWGNGGSINLCRLSIDSGASCWSAIGMLSPVFDREGSIWWARTNGIYRVRDPASLDPRNPAALMARAEFLEVAADSLGVSHDNTLWLFGSETISRLRKPMLLPEETPTGGIAAGDGDDIWLVSYSRGLIRIGKAGQSRAPYFASEDATIWSGDALAEADSTRYLPMSAGVRPDQHVVLERHLDLFASGMRVDRDENGDLYVCRIAPAGLTRFRNGSATDIPLPPLDPHVALRGAKRDRHGHLWLGVSRNRTALYRWDGERWIANGGLPLADNQTLNGYQFSSDNTLWIAAGQEGAIAVKDGRLRRLGIAEGVDVGLASEIFTDARGEQIWVAGSQGLALRQGDRFITLVGQDNEYFAGVSGLVQLDNGDVWMAGNAGITRIAASEWRRVLREPGYRVRFMRLDRADGVLSPVMHGPFPAVARSTDGALWFGMQTGLFRIDPDAMPDPAPPPRVLLTRVLVDEQLQLPGSIPELPPGLHRLSVSFAAPGAERPQRTRFRYRLARNGDWDEWVALGMLPQLSFERLQHGQYTLQIAASGRDGDWSTQPTTFNFRVLPAFHQTAAFYAALVALVIALCSLFYLIRVRHISARIRGEMNARLRERERIARDLHDTLLQGVQALLLNFQALALKLSPQDATRQRMERLLDRAEDVLREGRDRVSQLRDPAASTLDLADSLQRHARDLATGRGMLCEVEVPQPPRKLTLQAHEELLQVGREAIANAFRHSGGQQVRVTLDYRDEGVTLQVVDDGIGMPERAAGPTDGHWGLRGMRERAGLVGATLSIQHGNGDGTVVRMWVPRDNAYP